MTRAATLLATLLVGAPFFVACGGNEPSPPAAATLDAGAPAAAAVDAAPIDAGAVAQSGAPKIGSAAAVHDFGAIKATDSIEHVFTINNAGTADLKIERVQRT